MEALRVQGASPGWLVITAAFWCPECSVFHRRQIWADGLKLPDGIALMDGLGAGHFYRLAASEDLGDADGVSVPVYRPTCPVGDLFAPAPVMAVH
jgi:hypothetical protein